MASSEAVPELDRIREALTVSYDARATNQARQDALRYLDDLKARPVSPQYGFLLAREPSYPAELRQYGLSLLEHALRYNWAQHSEEQSNAIKDWVIALSGDITANDTSYYRNKLAWLWAQLAKRTWAATWLDMDRYLEVFWHPSRDAKMLVSRHFVLDVLGTLSEDICIRDEPVAMLRQEALGQALNEIMIPRSMFEAHLEPRGTAHQVRSTQEGWFQIMCQTLRDLLNSPSSESARLIVKLLQAIRPTVSWISLQTMVQTDCVIVLMRTVSTGEIQILTAAIECLFDIANRPYLPHLHNEWTAVVRPLLQTQSLDVFRQCYTSSIVPGHDIDDAKYTFAKKISEVLSRLGDATTRHTDLRPDSDQMAQFYDLLITVLKSESLSISLPALHSLCLTLESGPKLAAALDPAVSVLLGTCSQRLLRYECMPEDTSIEAILFLQDDYETLPEQHAFLGNYRRYCNTIISHISQRRPLEALQHILGETLVVLKQAASLDTASFTRSDMQVLQLQAQLSVVRSALTGYVAWARRAKRSQSELDPEAKATMEAVSHFLQQSCHHLMQISSPRADVACLLIQLLVEVASKIQDISRDFVQALGLWILDMRISRDRADPQYKDAVKNFLTAWLAELQRLATAYPNFLYPVYDVLEDKVNQLSSRDHRDARTRWGLQTFLIILCHRAFALDENTRMQRLQQMTQGLSSAWQNQQLIDGLSSPPAFLNLLGLGDLVKYLSETPFETYQDWSSQPLDGAGRSLVTVSEQHIDSLPMRMTTSILSATTDRLSEGSGPQEIARALWAPLIPLILPNMLKLLSLATGFANPDNWQTLSPEKQRAMKSIFTDRFWQSGISNESKDDFNARISQSGDTFEGFASSVRGTPRNIRDSCYHTIHRLVRFTDAFFGMEGLPQPLADAIFGQAQFLTVHHLQRTTGLVERVIDKCPPYQLRDFLPPLLALTFSKADNKLSHEWSGIEQAHAGNMAVAGDTLDREMQAESVVRTTEWSVVSLVASLLEDRRPRSQKTTGHEATQNVRQVVLSELTVLEPLLVFCAHALRMRDTRCCSLIARTLVTVLPAFVPASRSPTTNPESAEAGPGPQVREFFCSEILRAAITSLNEPYFVDCQRDLAVLITAIIVHYAPLSNTPHAVLLSLPQMTEDRVYPAISQAISLRAAEKRARAVILELLDSVRGVSVAEAGKIHTSPALNGSNGHLAGASRKVWLKDFEQQKQRAQASGMDVEGGHGRDGVSPGLEGVGDMFGDGAGG